MSGAVYRQLSALGFNCGSALHNGSGHQSSMFRSGLLVRISTFDRSAAPGEDRA
jgi:hypothetical protein